MLTVLKGWDSEGVVFKTVLRVGTEAECVATKNALAESLDRAGVTVDPTISGPFGILGLEVDDTDDATIAEGQEVTDASSIVVKADPQRAIGA